MHHRGKQQNVNLPIILQAMGQGLAPVTDHLAGVALQHSFSPFPVLFVGFELNDIIISRTLAELNRQNRTFHPVFWTLRPLSSQIAHAVPFFHILIFIFIFYNSIRRK